MYFQDRKLIDALSRIREELKDKEDFMEKTRKIIETI